jgi:hypothetical protein
MRSSDFFMLRLYTQFGFMGWRKTNVDDYPRFARIRILR